MALNTDVQAVLPLVRTRTLVLHTAADPSVRSDHVRYLGHAPRPIRRTDWGGRARPNGVADARRRPGTAPLPTTGWMAH